MAESAPSAVDLQEFQFKLHSKLKIFDFTEDSQFKAASNIVAAASRYGLIFIGSPSSSFQVVHIKSIEASSSGKVESSNYPKRTVPLPSTPTHLALNCDQSLLAVIVAKDGCATVIIYSVPSFLSQNMAVVREVRVSVTSGVSVLETCWNPAMPTVYTACKSDGSLGVYIIQENSVDINEIPAMARATSFCWSPKGKQIVVGSMNGTLTQYKPDLKAVKAIPAPPLQGTGPFSIVNIFWLTNYQFVAVYNDVGKADARPIILIVNAPKAGAITYINYEDICYSYGNLRPPQYYIIHQPIWGVVLVASANSMEVGVLGIAQSGEPAIWQQWNQIDAARAELPLSANHQETFPVGFAFDTGITMQLPWGENQMLPAMPMIHILSHHGVLCSFSVINIRPSAATLCTPPEPVADQSGLGQFKVPQQPSQSVAPAVIASTALTTPALQSKPVTQSQAVPFGLPAGSSPAPVVSPPFPKPTSQLGSPFSGSSALFGATPNLGAPPIQSPVTTASTSAPTMNLPVSSAPMFSSLGAPAKLPAQTIVTPTLGAVSSSSPWALNFSLQSNAPSISATSAGPTFGGSTLFGGGSAPPSVTDGTAHKIPPIGLAVTQAPNFQSINLSAKPAASASVPVVPTVTSVAPKVQAVAATTFAAKLVGQPLLATPKDVQPITIVPKQPVKLDILSNTLSVSHSQPPVQIAQPASTSSVVRKDDAALSNKAIHYQILEEIKNFQYELQELLHRCKNINLTVGAEEEKSSLVLSTDSLMEFYRELQDTTDSLMTDVHHLKQAIMQSFAWYEDSKSRQKRYTDPNIANLLQTQELDPFSEKQLTYIKHLIYDIESQMKQVDRFLDNQWAEFQDFCKRQSKSQMRIPTLEPVYQSLVRQNAILEKQRYLLKDVANRIKTRNRKAASFPAVMNINLSSSKDALQIDEQLGKLKLDDIDLDLVKYEKVVNTERKFTQSKQSKLCDYFTNRSVVHIAPKKPKWLSNPALRTSSKVTSYNTPPHLQRSLAQTFENIAQSKFDSASVTADTETNVSSANLFSFTLPQAKLENSSPVQQKPVASTPDIQSLKTASNVVASVPESNSSTFSNMRYSAPTTTAGKPGQVFSFTAATTNVTQSKPQFFTSNTTTQSSVPVNFSLGSNITITPVSSQVDKDKPNQVKPNIVFSFSQNKIEPTSAKGVEATKDCSKPTLSQPEVVLIKPNVVKTSASIESNMFGGIPTPEVKSQSFAFTIPQPKTTSAVKEPTAAISAANIYKISGEGIGQGRDSLDTTPAALNFGNALSLGQQSTPKPKSGFSLIFSSQSSALTAPTSVASATVDAASSPVANTQKVVPKPSFNIAQPTVSVAPRQLGSLGLTSQMPATTATLTVTPVVSKVEPVATAADLTTSSFGNVSVSTSATSTPSMFKQPSFPASAANTNSPSSTSSIFSGISVSSPVVSVFAQPITSTSLPTLPTAAATSPIFAQPISSPSATAVTSSASIFGNTQSSTGVTPFEAKSTAPQMTTASLAPKAETTSTTNPSSSNISFSFLQSAASVSAVETPKTTSSIFGGAAQTSVTTGFATPVVTPTTEFSFLQPWGGTTSQQAAPVTSATIFSSAGDTKPTETANPNPEPVKSSQDSAFGFNSLTVSSADNNKFSFGNLTVSALSPNANTTTATVPAEGTNAFSFALPDATNAPTTTTTTTTSFTGFGSSVFGKSDPTATTASSFMGQPICSPSTFAQNTSPAFGQSAGNIFAQKASTPSTTGGSIFGQSSGGSLFGGTGAATTATCTASMFGQTASTPFGSSAPSAVSKPGSIFAQSSDFGGNAAPPTTTTTSIFGQSTFGAPAATVASSTFSFTQAAGVGATGFGASSGSMFGAKPAFAQAPAFGQTATFGAPPAFGSAPAASASVFGNPATPAQNTGAFGSGFGSTSAFGQKPVFGSPPSFGQTAFGAPAGFGGSPSFGSPPQMFAASPGAASTPGGTFGAAVQENSTFANLANQNTLGFGNLAQNQTTATPPQGPAFSGGSQFSSWR